MRVSMYRALVALALVALLAGMFVFSPSTTFAKNGCSAFRVTVNGRTFSGAVHTTIPASQLGDGRMTVRGEFVGFGVDLNTFTVRNYTLRGTTDDTGLTTRDVVLFAQKRALHGATLTGSLSLWLGTNGSLIMQRSGHGQTMKIRARNCSQGGIFQMELEPGTRFAHTLGNAMQYCQPVLAPNAPNAPSAPSEVLFVRRDNPRNAAGDFVLTEDSLVGRERPQAARLLSMTDDASRWLVNTGGRMGMVLGEDAYQGVSCTPEHTREQ